MNIILAILSTIALILPHYSAEMMWYLTMFNSVDLNTSQETGPSLIWPQAPTFPFMLVVGFEKPICLIFF